MTKKKTSGTRKLKKAKVGSSSLIKKQKNFNSLRSIKYTLPKIGKKYDYLTTAFSEKEKSLLSKGSKKLRIFDRDLKEVNNILNKTKNTLKKFKSELGTAKRIAKFFKVPGIKALNNNVKSVDHIPANESSIKIEDTIESYERRLQQKFIDEVLSDSSKVIRKAKNSDIFKQDYKNALIGIKNFLLLFMDDKDDINYNLSENIFKNYDDNVRNPSKGSRYSTLKEDISLKTILESLKAHKVNNNIRDSDIKTINSILNNIQRDIKNIPFETKFLFFPDVGQTKAHKLAIKKFLKFKNKIDSSVDEIISILGCNIKDLFNYYYNVPLDMRTYEHFTKHILLLLPTINTELITLIAPTHTEKLSHNMINSAEIKVGITNDNRIMMTLLHAVYRLKFLIYIDDRDEQIYSITLKGQAAKTISKDNILYKSEYSLVPM